MSSYQVRPRLSSKTRSRSFKIRKIPHARLATYNIQHGGGNNLNKALRAMDQMRIDFGLFTETKIPHNMYTKECDGYTVFATRAESSTCGGVALFYRTASLHWSIEGIRAHGPNVISCTLVSGLRRWSLIGCYIAPSETDGATLN
jgi:exonuclease III